MNGRGFTLVETVVSLTIFSFVLMMVSLVLVRGYASYMQTTQRVDVQESLRIALDQMSTHIRSARASTVNITADRRQMTFMNGQGSADGYRFNGVQQDVEERFVSDWLPIASNVKALSFDFDNADNVVTINICGGRSSWKQSSSITLSTKVHIGVP